ncbi:MAG: hypothetical protein QM759_13740 [Terricaulis sp.]
MINSSTNKPVWDKWVHTACALFGFALSADAFYPGIFTPDSLEQFSQAQSGEFGDWHPPAMAALWRALNAIHLGPELLFFLHLALFWSGVWMIADALVRRGWRWGALFPLIGLLPFVFNFLGLLWKDVAVACAWTFAAGVAFRRMARGKKLNALEHTAVWLAFLYGALVRANTIFAAAPLALYLLSGDIFTRRLWPQLAALVLAPALILSATAFVNHTVLQADAEHPEDSLFLFDLVGISRATGAQLVPGPWTPQQAALIPTCYHPDKWDWVGMGKCEFLTSTLDDRHIWGTPVVRQAWIQAIATHPATYAAHRLAFSNEILRWLGPIPVNDSFMESEMSDARWRHHPGLLFRAYQKLCVSLASTSLFRPYFWLLLSLCTLTAAWFAADSPQRRFAGALSASAAIYVLTYLPFGVASDFRYIYWSIIATLAALAALLACELKRPRTLLAASAAVLIAAIGVSALS